MSSNTTTDIWQSLSNSALTPSSRHRVRFLRQRVTRWLSCNCYLPRRISEYFKLKSYISRQAATHSDEGPRARISSRKSLKQQIGSNIMRAMDLRDNQCRDKMRSKTLMRTQADVESRFWTLTKRKLHQGAPKTATPQVSTNTGRHSSRYVKRAPRFTCDWSKGRAKGGGLKGTWKHANISSNVLKSYSSCRTATATDFTNNHLKRCRKATSLSLISCCSQARRTYKYRVQCNRYTKAFMNPTLATATQQETMRSHEQRPYILQKVRQDTKEKKSRARWAVPLACWDVEANRGENKKQVKWADLCSESYLINREVCLFSLYCSSDQF